MNRSGIWYHLLWLQPSCNCILKLTVKLAGSAARKRPILPAAIPLDTRLQRTQVRRKSLGQFLSLCVFVGCYTLLFLSLTVFFCPLGLASTIWKQTEKEKGDKTGIFSFSSFHYKQKKSHRFKHFVYSLLSFFLLFII